MTGIKPTSAGPNLPSDLNQIKQVSRTIYFYQCELNMWIIKEGENKTDCRAEGKVGRMRQRWELN